MVRTVFLNIAAIAALPFLMLRKWYFRFRPNTGLAARLAIRKANRLHAETGYKYIVYRYGGRVVVQPKRLVKSMLARRGKYFHRHVTMADIERRALYITT